MQLLSPMSRRLRPLALALGAAGALVVPSAASAGTLTVDHGAHSVVYAANAGENNNLSFYRLSNTYRIQDEPAGSVPLTEIGGSLCDMGEPWKYRCPAASVATASVALGDGTDIFDATNSSVAVTLMAGTGTKTIKTGSAADSISARNAGTDQISCGAGADSVVADPEDVVDPSCELVDTTGPADEVTDAVAGDDALGGSTGGSEDADSGTAGTDSTPNVFKTPVGLTVAITTIPLSNSQAHVRLACGAEAIGGCRGDVVIELPLAAKKSASNKVNAARGQYVAQQRRRGRRIGKRTYRIAAGKRKTIAVPVLLRSHYRYVSKRRRTRAVMRITERNAAGKVIDVQTRSITLKPRKPAGKRGQR
jgi:hypothetical protein